MSIYGRRVALARSRKCQKGGICSEAVGRGPVGRKIMIHSEQIPTLFLTDKILEVAGSVYHESREQKKKEKHTREGRCVVVLRSNRRKSLAAAACRGRVKFGRSNLEC